MEQQGLYQAALYCRLSQDDGLQGDSSSIQTQKMMLEKYCKDNNFSIYDYFVDDGFSGTNFNRPSFQRLLKEVENGKVNLVITKDLSRLGRDYIMTGYYSEVYFPEKNVRYIAINDNVDSSIDNNDIAPFKNILNDMYAKDISRKIKSSLRQRALQGMYTGSAAPYGYKKDPDDKSKLIIDPEPAGVVRKIFSLMLSGYGAVYIARQLTLEKIDTPAISKAKLGDTRFHRYFDNGRECRWNDCKVHKILIDPTYTGAVVNGKVQVTNHKTKKRVASGKANWIVVPNMHEPIITQEEFDRAQKLIKERHIPRKYHKVDNFFKGLIKCSVCGRSMHLSTQMRRGRMTSYYRCNAFTSYRTDEKHWTTIKYEEIRDIVVARLKEHFSSFKDDEKLKAMIRERIVDSNLVVNYEKELAQIERRKVTLTNITKKVYEDYFAGALNEETYQELVKKYQTEQKDLQERYDFLFAEQNKKDDTMEDQVQSFLNLKTLKRSLFYSLIESIVISNTGAFKKPKQRTVDITYRFAEPQSNKILH